MPLHKNLTGTDLHEPKGIAGQTANKVYVSDGSNSGAWSDDLTLGDVVVDSITATDATLAAATVSGILTVDELVLSNSVWGDILVNLSTTTGGGTLTPPTWTKINDNGAGSPGVWAYSFSGTAAATNYVVFQLQLPHAYRDGTTLKPHVHWVQAGTGAGTVRWYLEYCIYPYNTVVGSTTVTYADATAPAAVKKAQLTALPDIDGSSCTGSTIISCTLWRDAAQDTCTDAVYGLYFDMHIELDKLGSNEENP